MVVVVGVDVGVVGGRCVTDRWDHFSVCVTDRWDLEHVALCEWRKLLGAI